MQTKLIVGAVVVFVLSLIGLAIWPFTQIDAGERGVLLSFGKVERVLEPGIHYVNPFTQDVEKISVRTQIVEVDATASSKDLQAVSAKVALNFSIMTERVEQVYSEVKNDYSVVFVAPAIQESIKAATAKYTAEELVTKREEVKELMKAALKERLAKANISVSEVSITNFDFSSGFNASIEAKVKAQQDALTQQNKLAEVEYKASQAIAQAKGEADSRVLQAKAEAEAIKVQAQSLMQSPQYLELKRIEVELEYAKHYTGAVPSTLIVGQGAASSPVLPWLNLVK